MKTEDSDCSLLTPTQVAATLRVPRRRVVTRALRRELPWVKIGQRTLRLPASALAAFIRQKARASETDGLG